MMGNKNIPIHQPTHPLRSGYIPIQDTVYAPKDSYLLAHELGHASGLLGKNKILGTLATAITHKVGGPGIASLVRGYDSALKSYNRAKGYTEEDDSKAIDYTSKATQLATAGQLAEEAQASIRGLNAIRKIQGNAGMWRAAKLLGPVYGTYVLGALGSHAIAPYVGKRVGEYMAKTEEH